METGSLCLAPTRVGRNLGVRIDDQRTISNHVASVAWSCHSALCNVRKLRPYVTQPATQQAGVISGLDSCNDYPPHGLTSK